MKCKGCNKDIRDTLEMIEEAVITRVTQILGVIADEEDNLDGLHELVTGKIEEEEEDFELVCYQCSYCAIEYSHKEMLEVFKKGEVI